MQGPIRYEEAIDEYFNKYVNDKAKLYKDYKIFCSNRLHQDLTFRIKVLMVKDMMENPKKTIYNIK